MSIDQITPPIIFLFGAIFGSFLNVVILRYLSGDSAFRSRSSCPHCKKTLRWWELFPIISFVLLRGHCQRCYKTISIQYPIVELVFGLVFLAVGTPLPVGVYAILSAILSVIIIAILLILFVIDLRTLLLPDIFIWLMSGAVFIKLVVDDFSSVEKITSSIYGVLIGAGFLFFLWAITKGKGIGFGDVKLMIPLGALLGIQGTITLLFLSFVFGGLIGIFLLLRKKATLGTAIPFGPFLACAAILIILLPNLPLSFISFVWPMV